MKKYLVILLGLIMALALAGCGESGTSGSAGESETAAATEETAAEETTAEADEAGEDSSILIAYFSAANMNDPDAVTQATPMTDGVAATEAVALNIQEATDGKLVKIMPAKDYPTDYNECTGVADKEKEANDRPEFNLDDNPEDYDTIFIGFPIWWYQEPMIIDSFFDTYDLSGKTIIPFNTHAGSQDSGSYDNIAAMEPGATVLKGFPISGGSAADSWEEVADWLTEIGY